MLFNNFIIEILFKYYNLKKVIVRPQPQQLIERIIERPRTPPPKIIDKEICEPAPPPIVRTRIVKVDHSPRHYANSTPIRYNIRPQCATTNYAPCSTEYDYMGLSGYDQSYSQSYSTTELFPPTASVYPNTTAGYTTANLSVYPTQMYQTQQPACPQATACMANAMQPQQHQHQMQMSCQQAMQAQPQQTLQPQYAQMQVGPSPMLQYGYTYNTRQPQQQQQQQPTMQAYNTNPQLVQGIPSPYPRQY